MRIRIKNRKLLITVLISFIGILFFSASSIFYPINEWQDVNIYYTIGKGMHYGLVPYHDLIDQKGPVIFFLYYIAYALTPNSFFGLAILQMCSMAVFLYYIGKIADYIVANKYTVFVQMTMAAIIFSSSAYFTGGSAEEFILALWAISMFDLLNIRSTEYVTRWTALRSGIITGIVLFAKFNLLGFWAVLCLTVAVIELRKKDYSALFQLILFYVFGIVLITAFIMLYFVLNDAEIDLFNKYFYDNLFLYSSRAGTVVTHSGGLIMKIKEIAWNIYAAFMNERLFVIVAAIGFMATIPSNIKNYLSILTTIGISLIVYAIGIYWGNGFHAYYVLALAGYLVFPICAIFYRLDFLLARVSRKLVNDIGKISKVLYAIVLFVITWNLSSTTSNFMKPKDETAQYKIANEIDPDATILNYGFLDSGFYFATKTIPNVPYFFCMNYTYEELPEMFDSQRRYVEEELCDYIITRQKNEEEFPDIIAINPSYEEVCMVTESFRNIEMHYRLYRLKG